VALFAEPIAVVPVTPNSPNGMSITRSLNETMAAIPGRRKSHAFVA